MCAGAHAARFNRNVQGCPGESIVAERPRSFPENHDFCVRGGIAIADSSISRARNNLRIAHQHGTHRNFTS
jgi:hypothetical protein